MDILFQPRPLLDSILAERGAGISALAKALLSAA
jgi:hypothetical protein